ncbi:hypothetical protein RFI_16228 [Reticulomyxa filosa]|uniref:SH3 domain-containing protein n=1 Tax=Reticulomyxa filosa TaxID=46433 RepID=X6N6Q4_RETFI|nr:hypothetical protein RFI_16228 [Reticulomyxa filosa]|eukprot:ETO20977.1 hypothetical protein RFI_16228 [Reticulomyxa filosa]
MEEEFRCRAINDYYASVADELDLREGCEYVIMQVSPSGWWYAVDENGEDGWVPSNYLVRIDDNGKEINEEDYDHQGDDGKSAEPANVTDDSQAVEQPLPEEPEVEEETYVQKKSVASQPSAPQVQTQIPPPQVQTQIPPPPQTQSQSRQGSVSTVKTQEPKKTTTQEPKKTTTQEQKKTQEPAKTASTSSTAATKATTNPSANKTTTQNTAKKSTAIQPLNLNVDDGAPGVCLFKKYNFCIRFPFFPPLFF